MRRIFLRFKRPTIFLAGSILTILYSVPLIFYYIPRNGGESMYALLYIYYIFFAVIALVIDFGLISFINFKLVSIIEIMLILFVYLIICYNTKKVILDISAVKKPYIIIVDDPRGIGKKSFDSRWLFDKVLKVKDTDVLHIDKSSIANYEIVFKDPESWHESESTSSRYKPETVYDCEFVVAQDSVSEYSDQQIDGILRTKLLITKH